MKRKKTNIIGILLIVVVIAITIAYHINSTKSKNRYIVKIGIIDAYIPEETLDKMGIISINYTNNNDKNNYNEHGEVTLNIIKNECKSNNIFYASVLNNNNTSSIENVVSAIEWCISNKVDIICMSFATPIDNIHLKNAIQQAKDAHIIITASCINLSDIDCYPAMYKNVISVSEGMNKNATIKMKNRKMKVKINGKIIEKQGTSISNAYVCGYIANQISQGNRKVEKILKKLNDNIKIIQF
ncbi:MAG: hypothetical protein IKD76_06570 [Clostridia bacterium]|nr:hypothetical protein [Clostridia bacterium]